MKNVIYPKKSAVITGDKEKPMKNYRPREKYIRTENGNTVIMGKSVQQWADQFGLPLHLYNEPAIEANLNSFRDVFARLYPRGKVRFAAKAMTHPLILSIVARCGCGADAASFNEVRCCLEAGIPPRDIDLNGNCKEDSLIEEAIEKNMLLVADSAEEFSLISDIARRMNKKVRVILRISGYDMKRVTASSVFTAGKWTKFGEPLENIPGFIKTLNRHPHLDFQGFHTHIGSQITEVEPYRQVMGKMLEMGHLLREEMGSCPVINIGGGFPVSYLDEDMWEKFKQMVREGHLASREGDMSKLMSWDDDMSGFSSDLSRWVGEKFYSPYPKEKMLEAILTGQITVRGRSINTVEALKDLGSPEIMVEPGRAITEDAGVSLAKVGHIRRVAGGHNLVTLEMGVMDHCDALVEQGPRQWGLAEATDNSEAFETFLGGNLCFSGDMIATFKVTLPGRPRRGDVLISYDTGAYCSWFMSSNTNSFPRPPRVLVSDNGKCQLMKSRDTYQGIFS